jgi:hypothetical protein
MRVSDSFLELSSRTSFTYFLPVEQISTRKLIRDTMHYTLLALKVDEQPLNISWLAARWAGSRLQNHYESEL